MSLIFQVKSKHRHLSPQQAGGVGDFLHVIIAQTFTVICSDASLPAEYLSKLFPEGRAADGVDEGVGAAVAHGQPVGDQEDEVDVMEIIDLWITCLKYEVCLVWEPADTEDDYNSDKHEDCFFLVLEDDQILCCDSNSWGDRPPQTQRYVDICVAHHEKGEDVLKDNQENVVEIKDFHLNLSPIYIAERYFLPLIPNDII